MASVEYREWRQRWPQLVVERRTEEAVELLERYYAVGDAGLPAYSGSQFEVMAALNTDPYSIGPADFTAASMLSVSIPAKAAIRVLGPSASEITRLLHQIPAHCDIVETSPDDLIWDAPASQLWRVLRRGKDGMGRTRTSKLLAAKRPGLLPIWDSFVEMATGLGTMDYWRQFQAVVTADDHAIWMWLTELRPHAPNMPAAVSNLRMLDVLLWMSVDRNRLNQKGDEGG